MATRAANKRLTREYKSILQNPPPYIIAHPSETNILEWHYILTGPPETPYRDGQYWGTLIFPSNYPFAPPAIRMHTPSGRFQPSTRLCLSISDFHPKSFNPAWEVSTILIGLLSFMTSEEMTTGSVSATDTERKWAAGRTRWWNSTGGGSWNDSKVVQKGNIKAGDGGLKFRTEWPLLDQQNWEWMKENKIDVATSKRIINATPEPTPCGVSEKNNLQLGQKKRQCSYIRYAPYSGCGKKKLDYKEQADFSGMFYFHLCPVRKATQRVTKEVWPIQVAPLLVMPPSHTS